MTRRHPPSMAHHHISRGAAAAVAAILASLLLPLAGLFAASAALIPIAIIDARKAAHRRQHRHHALASIGAGTAVGPVTPGRRYRSKIR